LKLRSARLKRKTGIDVWCKDHWHCISVFVIYEMNVSTQRRVADQVKNAKEYDGNVGKAAIATGT
jgi:hypothetical protein